MGKNNSVSKEAKELINAYNLLVKGIEAKAVDDDERAYGGIIRAGKGLLVENLTKHIVEIAWKQLNGEIERLSLEKQSVRIPLKKDYITRIKSPEVRKFIKENIKNFYYSVNTDVHVCIDNKFVIGIECKAFTENSMMKRILVDFTLLKQVYPNLHCVLLQLESQLGGDYSNLSKKVTLGSYSTHTLLSYFDIDLNIITLLEGERKVDKPIHKFGFFKELHQESLLRAIEVLKNLLKSAF